MGLLSRSILKSSGLFSPFFKSRLHFLFLFFFFQIGVFLLLLLLLLFSNWFIWLNFSCSVEDYVAENGGTNYSGQFKNLDKLVKTLDKEILSKLDGSSDKPTR